MKRCAQVALLLIALGSYLSSAADASSCGLDVTWFKDRPFCETACPVVDTTSDCRKGDEWCADSKAFKVPGAPYAELPAEPAATNQYGYTNVYRSTATLPDGYEVLYLEKFEGDRLPRILETWMVHHSDYRSALVVSLSASAFTTMLSRGEKLSSEWSPIVSIQGQSYLIERECSGRWEYGAYYNCEKITEFTLIGILGGKNSAPYCEFSLPKF